MLCDRSGTWVPKLHPSQKKHFQISGFLPAIKAFHDCNSNKSGGGIYSARLVQLGQMSFKKCTARRSGGAVSITDFVNTDLLKSTKGPLRTSKQLPNFLDGSFELFGVDLV